jgi:hypothetical protein
MITYYSIVGPDGYIVQSQLTEDPNYYITDADVEAGYRLLKDISPSHANGDFNRYVEYPIRVEPIPLEATEVPYIIAKLETPLVVDKLINPEIDEFIKSLLDERT